MRWRSSVGLLALGWTGPSALGQEVEFALDRAVFETERAGARPAAEALTVACCDHDRDGDADVLINWHNAAPLELWENRSGRLWPVATRTSGLFDWPGVPSLYADSSAMEALVAEATREGLFLWHEPERRGAWQFRWRGSSSAAPAFRIRTNRPVLGWEAPEGGRIDSDTDGLRVQLPADVREAAFAVRIHGVSQRLDVQAEPPDAGALFVGPDAVAFEGQVVLWPPDPHGLAWVDVGGTRHPELFVGRGALAGTLSTDAEPKWNRFFARADDATTYRLELDRPFPAEWGRARQVAWVDVDGDGRSELYVGNRTSPNALYVRGDDGRYEDRAPALGIDPGYGDAFGWLDLDRDGWDDLLILKKNNGLTAWRNVGGRRFEELDPSTVGIDWRAERAGRHGLAERNEFFESATFHTADFDADGRLDLLVAGYGPARTLRLFLGTEQGFRNASEPSGLGGVTGVRLSLTIDADNDGREDVLLVSDDEVRVSRNVGGGHFEIRAVEAAAGLDVRAACVGDVDGDGREDVVAVDVQGPLVLRNRTTNDHGHLRVASTSSEGAPVGALVTASYSDGRRRVQRVGGARNGPLSQTAEALHFGVPAGVVVESLTVRWPGATDEVVRRLEPGRAWIEIER